MQINTSSIERDYLREEEGRENGRRWGKEREREGEGAVEQEKDRSKRHKRIKGVPRKLRSINKCVSFSFFFSFFLFPPIRHAIFMLVQNKILITNGRLSVAIHETGSRTFRFVRVSISHFLLAISNLSHNLFSSMAEKLELQPRQPRAAKDLPFFSPSPLFQK